MASRAALLPSVLPALALVAACAPMSVERAEEACFDRAGLVAVGAGTGGAKGKLELSVSSDWLQGKDPAALYNSCVYQKSGRLPRRPLYDRPDWKG